LIDFRYHLVSIVAIFLSLALGLIIGASALQGTTASTLHDLNKSLSDRNSGLQSQLTAERHISGYDNQVLTTMAPQFVAGRLKNESVVFVAMPGSDDQVRTSVYNMITQAGARLTGTVTMQDKYLQNDQLATLDTLTDTAKPASVTLPADATSPYQKAALELGGILVTGNRALAGQEDPDAGTVLSAFKTAGYLNYTGKPTGRATLAVVVAPSNPSGDKNADAENQAMVYLAGALGADGIATAMVGPSTAAAGGGLINALRNSKVDGQISTVDTADLAAGQVTTVLALQQQIHQKKTGDYGMSGSDGAVPSPLPVPAGSVTPSSTPSKRQ
jgi:Copper transport outer membrane protein, MctB